VIKEGGVMKKRTEEYGSNANQDEKAADADGRRKQNSLEAG
jgi:hypothetical protein